VTFDVGGGDFFQSNRHLLDPLVNWVASHCGASGGLLSDLYGGTGFFSLTLANRFDRVVLVESDRGMVHRASASAQRNGIRNLKAIALPAEQAAAAFGGRPDVMIVDPPRPGLTREAREAVALSAPATLIYVSCNNATQARDCGFFTDRAGYTIESTALFDLYPNTHHTETVVVMRRAG
jgi:tRNA/tmRNA/rRNA uracil-C5-methylase (TrmA/RlmC/RlmD family)